MKVFFSLRRLMLPALFAGLFMGGFFAPQSAQAGLTVQVIPTRYNYGDNYYYYVGVNLFTNGTLPDVPFGNYFISTEPGANEGSSASYVYDTNGFNGTGGGGWGYNDFPTLLHAITNGLWSITYSNNVTTNIYYFAVSSTLTSNSLPNVVITYPTNGAANIPNQPVFTWTGGPANVNQETAYISDPSGNYNYGNYLPPTS